MRGKRLFYQFLGREMLKKEMRKKAQKKSVID
jgi:hypothetical protein